MRGELASKELAPAEVGESGAAFQYGWEAIRSAYEVKKNRRAASGGKCRRPRPTA